MRKIVLCLYFLFSLFPLSVFAVVPRGEDYFVMDEASILKKDTVQYIRESSMILHNIELINYYVVTVPDLGTLSIEEYADQLFDEYSIGDNGLLVLVSKEDYLLRVQIGGELARFISEDLINNYIDVYFSPYIEHGDWNTGIRNGYNAFYKLICDYYHLDTSTIVLLDKVDFKTKYADYILIAFAIIIMILSKLLIDMWQNIFVRKKYKDSMIDYFLFALLLSINGLVLVLSCFLKPFSCLVLIIVEGISLYSFYQNKPSKVLKFDTIYNFDKKKADLLMSQSNNSRKI